MVQNYTILNVNTPTYEFIGPIIDAMRKTKHICCVISLARHYISFPPGKKQSPLMQDYYDPLKLEN